MDGAVAEDVPLIAGTILKASSRESSASKSSDNEAPSSSDNLKKDGLSVAWAMVFVFGFMLGAGALAMPLAFSKAGWYGLVSIAVCTMSQMFAAVLLSKSWVSVRETHPDIRHISNPYPLMGEKALGRYMSILISTANGLYNVGLSVVLLLLCGQNIQSVVAGTRAELSFCYWVIIMTVILIPLSWLKTPNNFRLVGLASLMTIVTACSVIAVLLVSKLHDVGPSANVESQPTPMSYFLSLGIMFYSYSGNGVYPTIQEDMRDKSKFTTVVVASSLVLTGWYVLIGSLGYIAYGTDVTGNVIQSLPRGRARIGIELLTSAHMLSGIITAMNPLFQDIESIEYLNMSQDVSIKHCVLRTSIMCLVTFVGLSLPNFSGLQALIGATVSQFLSFVAPCLIYWRLSVKEEPSTRPMPVSVKVASVCVLAYALLGGIVCTYSAVTDLFSSKTFIAPCYISVNTSSRVLDNS